MARETRTVNAEEINSIIEHASNIAFENDQEIALTFGEGESAVSITVNPLSEEDEFMPEPVRTKTETITNGIVMCVLIIAVAVVFLFYVRGALG